MTRSLLLLLPLTFSAGPTLAQIGSMSNADLARGKRLFEAQCGRCHGMRGLGGDGPNLARPRLSRAPTDSALVAVIENGIPGTGMPAIWPLGETEVWQVAAYVRSLGRTSRAQAVGDSTRGEALFRRKGACTVCHIVRGMGEGLGPDLTNIGTRRGLDYLRQSIIDPAAALPEGLVPFYPAGYAEYLPVRAVTRDGRELRGMRVNEDAFTIQLRDETGRIHSFHKRDLTIAEKQFGQSLMPSYRGTFSEAELNDLVAYLASLRGES